jgi:hypothetical protein
MSNKRGQVTIFIIIALLLILIVLFVFLIFPRISTSGSFDTENPQAFIQSCVEDDLEKVIEIISTQGGVYDELLLFDYYQLEKVQYVCYTKKYGEPCNPKVASLRKHVENSTKKAIEEKVDLCFEELVNNYREQGFEVNLRSDHERIDASLLPQRVFLNYVGYEIDLVKGDNSQTYKNFNTRVTTNLRKLVDLASDIIDDEATRINGIDINEHRLDNLDVEIKVIQRTEGTKVYHLIDKETNGFFQFAVRSNVYLPGA